MQELTECNIIHDTHHVFHESPVRSAFAYPRILFTFTIFFFFLNRIIKIFFRINNKKKQIILNVKKSREYARIRLKKKKGAVGRSLSRVMINRF